MQNCCRLKYLRSRKRLCVGSGWKIKKTRLFQALFLFFRVSRVIIAKFSNASLALLPKRATISAIWSPLTSSILRRRIRHALISSDVV